MAWTRPETQQIRDALQAYAPDLADQPIEFLAEGWETWAFRAGDYLLRFPKSERGMADMRRPQGVWRELAPRVSTPIAVPDLYGERGPNGAPFAGHRFVPGVSLITVVQDGANASLAPTFGRELGIFLRELHRFPPERAVELGMPYKDGPILRAEYGSFYENVVRLVFPLIGCEARTYTAQRFETYLNQPSNFDFEPRLIHHDLDRQNVLIDPESGRLAGVIDWGDAEVGNPATDLWLPLVDFPALGIADQLQDCLDAYGPFDRQRAEVHVAFIHFLWPFHDILYGLGIGGQDFVEGGIRELNASVPRDVRCE